MATQKINKQGDSHRGTRHPSAPAMLGSWQEQSSLGQAIDEKGWTGAARRAHWRWRPGNRNATQARHVYNFLSFLPSRRSKANLALYPILQPGSPDCTKSEVGEGAPGVAHPKASSRRSGPGGTIVFNTGAGCTWPENQSLHEAGSCHPPSGRILAFRGEASKTD